MSDDYDLDSGPDPAYHASATPEVVEPTNPVYAVGIGPGNLEYLTPRGRRAIADAEVVVGFSTVVDFIAAVTDADLLRCGYEDELETLEQFGERVASGDAGTAVLMGDSKHSGYQFVAKVEQALDRPVRVIPGISSIQMAASRARTPPRGHQIRHPSQERGHRRRTRTPLGGCRVETPLGPAATYDCMPGDIAADFLENGVNPDTEALVLEHLTHDAESITEMTLKSLDAHAGGNAEDDPAFSDIYILAIRKPVDPAED